MSALLILVQETSWANFWQVSIDGSPCRHILCQEKGEYEDWFIRLKNDIASSN